MTVAVGSAKDPCPNQSSYLGELKTVKWALENTRIFRGETPTRVIIDNKGVVDALNKGIEAFCSDKRAARVFDYLCSNENWCTFDYLPGNANQVADQLSRMNPPEDKKPRVSNAKVHAVDRPSFDVIEQRIRDAHFGHWGPRVTIQNLLLDHERWEGMEKDVRNYIDECPNCAFNAYSQTRDLPSTEPAQHAGERVVADHAVPFFDGSHLLVIVDDATKYVEVMRTPGTGSQHAIKALDAWMSR